MQREEFSERAQTQKMDTNQGERARLENRRRFAGELAEGALQVFALEQTLGGQAGGFGAWLQATYELNEDFEEPYSKVVDDICQAFREVERCHGTAIAQHLYDVHSVILPTEIQSAADYLLLAGSRRISQRWQGAAFFWSIWTQMPSPGLSTTWSLPERHPAPIRPQKLRHRIRPGIPDRSSSRPWGGNLGYRNAAARES